MATPTWTRRAFLRCAVLAPLADRVRAGATILPGGARVPVVDTHVHCFAGKDDRRFPYHPRAPYRPETPATPRELCRVMDAAGVDHAVIVHPEPYQDDHRYLEYCLKLAPGRLKGTCLFFADRPEALERMRELARRVPLVALRIHAYAPERLPPFGRPELRALWKEAGELGLAVQLHFEPRYAAGFEPLIREFRAVRVIIDHLGRPFQGTQAEYTRVVGWSRYPNTVMKLAALPDSRAYPHRDIGPVIRRVAEAFGADRLIYGGGFRAGVGAREYRGAREQVAAFLGHLSAADRARVLGGTAARLFGLRS